MPSKYKGKATIDFVDKSSPRPLNWEKVQRIVLFLGHGTKNGLFAAWEDNGKLAMKGKKSNIRERTFKVSTLLLSLFQKLEVDNVRICLVTCCLGKGFNKLEDDFGLRVNEESLAKVLQIWKSKNVSS